MLDQLHQQTIDWVMRLEELGFKEEAEEYLKSFLKLKATVEETDRQFMQIQSDLIAIKNNVDKALTTAGYTLVNDEWMTPEQLKKWAAANHVAGEVDNVKGGDDSE